MLALKNLAKTIATGNIIFIISPRRWWVDNIKSDLRDVGWDGMNWIDLAQDRDQWRALVNTVMHLRVP
jgi:hypothetical protein